MGIKELRCYMAWALRCYMVGLDQYHLHTNLCVLASQVAMTLSLLAREFVVDCQMSQCSSWSSR